MVCGNRKQKSEQATYCTLSPRAYLLRSTLDTGPQKKSKVNGIGVVEAATLFWIIGSSTWIRMRFCMSPIRTYEERPVRPFGSLVVKVMMYGITRIIRCPAATNRTPVAIRLFKERSLSSLESSSARTATRKNDTGKWDMLRKQVPVLAAAAGSVRKFWTFLGPGFHLSASQGMGCPNHLLAMGNGGLLPVFRREEAMLKYQHEGHSFVCAGRRYFLLWAGMENCRTTSIDLNFET